MTDFEKRTDETELQYGWRLFTHVKNGEISWQELADLMNRNCRNDESEYRTESAYRKPLQSAEKYYNEVFAKELDNTGVATRILSISDCHVPFQLPIEKLADYKGKVDILQLNGDIGDCQSISAYPKIYRVSPMEELIETRKFIIDLIEYI